MKNFNLNFAYGMGSFLNIFDKEHRECFKLVLRNNLFIHTHFGYMGAPFFFKNITTSEEKKGVNIVLKVPGYELDQLKYEVEKNINEFGVEKFYGFHFWDKMPIKDDNSLDFNKLQKIFDYIDELKKNKVVNKTFLQLKPDGFLINEYEMLDYYDGFAFYGYPNEIQLKKKNYELIKSKKKFFLQFQMFGGRTNKIFRKNFISKMENKFPQLNKEEAWIKNCFDFSNKIFEQNLFSVGCTRKIDRLKYLINLITKPENKANLEPLSEEVRFSENATFITKIDYPISNHQKMLDLANSRINLIKKYLIILTKKIFDKFKALTKYFLKSRN